jgi:hypothetical protein
VRYIERKHTYNADPVLNNKVEDKELNINLNNNIPFLLRRALSPKNNNKKDTMLYNNILIPWLS